MGNLKTLVTRAAFVVVVAAAAMAYPLATDAHGATNGGPSLTATFVKTSDWGNGYVADYNILNSGASVAAWKLQFSLPASETVTGDWSGNLSLSGTTYTVTNAGWNRSLTTGDTAQFGFQGSYSGTFVPPQNCTINGSPCDGSRSGSQSGSGSGTGTGTGTGTGGTAPATMKAAFTKTSDWGNGFVGSYQVTNSGAAVLKWTLSFSLPSTEAITSAWSGILSQSGTTYTITNADWNGALPTGASTTTGFQGTYSGTFVPPSNCLINGNPCGSTSTGGSGSGSGSGAGTGSGTGTGTGTGSGTGTPLSPLSGSTNFPFAPYVDATVDTPPFDLAADLKASGTKYFTLGFIVAQGGCTASWGGFYPVSSGYYSAGIQALRAAGGDVIVSFGGEAGEELADACTSVSALQAQYQSVISEYNISHIDFDVEGADEGNTASLTRRFAAIAALEKANPTLSVSLTVPVLPQGLDFNGLNVVKSAIANGARIDNVNVMAMDYGDGPAPNPAGQMGTYAIDAARATEAQLATLYPTLTTAQLWHMVGVTALIGVNDITDEVFQVSDAQQLETFAAQTHLGRLSMWAATRDVACPGGAQTFSGDTCSSIVQQPDAFQAVLAKFTG
jgi:hypothetical protein